MGSTEHVLHKSHHWEQKYEDLSRAGDTLKNVNKFSVAAQPFVRLTVRIAAGIR